ncbi:MAG: hypothetical protein EBS90_11075 [Betaproteobacteria bacterium]|nr:hypothetical protein [Betaproteobacteria bacterium]
MTEQTPPRPNISFRDLLMARQNGFAVDEYQFFLWRREEELLRSSISFPQQYARSGVLPEQLEAPLHRVAWSAITKLMDQFPELEQLDPGAVASAMADVDAAHSATAMDWVRILMADLPVDPRIGLDLVVKDIFNHSRLRRWSSVQNGYLARFRKETNVARLQAEVINTSRAMLFEYEGEGSPAQPLGAVEWDSRDRSKVSVVRTGIDAIDRAAGGGHGRGELLVWGGGTSHGKSFAAQRLLRNQARLRQSALYISCEDALELMQCRMIADFCEPSVSPKEIRMRTADPEVVDRAVSKMAKELGDFVTVVEHKKPTVSQVCNMVRYYRYARNVDLVIVDYLQAVTPDEPSNSKVNDTALVISQLKKCFTDCGVAGVVLTQYSRQEYRDGEEPSINAAKYAGDIENEAEVLVFMWKDSDDTLHVKLPKVKWSRAKALRYTIQVNPITGCHKEWQENYDA